MVEWLELIRSDVTAQFLDPRKRLFVGYLLSASVIAVLWLCIAGRHSFIAAVRAVFDRGVWFSRSSRRTSSVSSSTGCCSAGFVRFS